MAPLRVAASPNPFAPAGRERGSIIPAGTQKNPVTPNGVTGFLADPKGFEPLTFWSVARRSIQLS